LKVLDFKLAYTTAQHYLEIYEDKNKYESKQAKELMELLIDLYALSGQIYKDHPLKIVQ
jgi:mRNA-degrading endonuclease YafQ of YafQ-DinJ toxin-antitoxin module